MGRTLQFEVIGTPAPQGSKRHVGKGRMVESSKKVKPWRQDVVAAATEAAERRGWSAPDGPVFIRVRFLLRRPAGHYGTGRNADFLKASAPDYPGVKPDLDKLVRSTLDALTTAGVIADDARVVSLEALKEYAGKGKPLGAFVTVSAA